jgi:hypothetical protein
LHERRRRAANQPLTDLVKAVKLDDPDLQAQQLLSIAQTRSGSGRATIQQVIDDLFHGRGNVLDPHDRAMLHRLLRSLCEEAEQKLRAAIQRCGHSDQEKLILSALDRDAFPVAHPLLMHSGAFASTTLIERLWHRVRQQRLSNLRRSKPSASGSDDFALSFHDELATPEIAQHLFLWVAAALRIHLLVRNQHDEGVVDDLIEAALEETGQCGLWPAGTPSKRGARSASSDEESRLIDLLRNGLVAEFESEFSRVSGIRPQLIGRMLYERGGEALATICVAIGVSKRGFAVFFILSRETLPRHQLANAQEVAHALAFYDSLNPDTANQVVARWRRGSAYLNAIRVLTADLVDVSEKPDAPYPAASAAKVDYTNGRN